MSAGTCMPSLLLTGTDLGLGFPDDKVFFFVIENGTHYMWTIGETLARFDEFSRAAQAVILTSCAMQKKYSDQPPYKLVAPLQGLLSMLPKIAKKGGAK